MMPTKPETRWQQWRDMKDEFFASNANAPLNATQQAQFEGLTYYDYNPALSLTLTVTPLDTPETVLIHTTTDELRNYDRYAHLTFKVDDEDVQLTIFKTPHGYFLPFVDANAGKETYPAGRYLDLQSDDGLTFHVDFNHAYNPFCVYSEKYSCPLTPPENRLKVAIKAGEKLPTGEWLPGK